MHHTQLGSLDFLIDYTHLTFFFGVLISYLYFRRRQLSIGGTLAAGYLAASLNNPLNVLMTFLISLVGYVLIKFVILKIFLPRPRQIFAIGLAVGALCGALWLTAGHFFFKDPAMQSSLSLVGVIVPGMLCNSLIKQGVAKTLIPLAWMVPLTAALGFATTFITSTYFGWSLAPRVFDHSESFNGTLLFALCAASVVMALLVQESTVHNAKLRTGGYVTVGLLIALSPVPRYLAIVGLAVLIVAAIYFPYQHKVPLFGKDRFIVLCFLSFFTVSSIELLLALMFNVPFNGMYNVVFGVLPAVIVNDLNQYGFKRTGSGMALSAVGSAVVGVPALLMS